jgi:hypothetical protein
MYEGRVTETNSVRNIFKEPSTSQSRCWKVRIAKVNCGALLQSSRERPLESKHGLMSTNVVIQKRTVSEMSATVWGSGGERGGWGWEGTEGRSALQLYTVPFMRHRPADRKKAGLTQTGVYDEISKESHGESMKRQLEKMMVA